MQGVAPDYELYLSFGLYLIILVAIGLMGFKVSHTFSDYILGGRKLGAWVTAISAQASDMSGWLLMGLPGKVVSSGVSAVWISIGLAGGTMFNWTHIARRLRRYSEILGALTMTDFFAGRFMGEAQKPIRLTCLFIIVVFYVIYISAQFVAAGTAVNRTFGLTYHEALLVSATVIVFYTMMGGFLAVAWTDLFQGMIMVAVVVVLPIVGVISLGGVAPVITAMAERGPEMLQVSAGKSGWPLLGALVIGGLAWGLGYPGMPHITVRYMAIEDEKKLKRSALISMIWVVLALWGAMAVGAVGLASIGENMGKPESVLIDMVVGHFPGWLAGACIAAVAAAIMSTVDSQILVLSSAFVEDFYLKTLGREADEKTRIRIGRAVTLLIGAASVWLCWDAEKGVFDYVSDAWAGLAAGFGPALILSLKWRRTTGWGVASGMVAGIAVALIWRHNDYLAGLIYELPVAFAAGLAVIVIVSLLSPPPGEEVLVRFDLAANEKIPLRDQEGNPIPLDELISARRVLDND